MKSLLSFLAMLPGTILGGIREGIRDALNDHYSKKDEDQ